MDSSPVALWYVRRVTAPLVPRPITSDAYAPYGRVLMASPRGEAGVVANLGTALRFDDLVDVENRRGASARLEVKLFRSRPVRRELRSLTLLEKHPHSTQLFVPMNASRYIVVVALGGDRPDLATLTAFLVEGARGISYSPGVWHHPMIALDVETDFVVFVHEDRSSEDCVVVARDVAPWPDLDLASLPASRAGDGEARACGRA